MYSRSVFGNSRAILYFRLHDALDIYKLVGVFLHEVSAKGLKNNAPLLQGHYSFGDLRTRPDRIQTAIHNAVPRILSFSLSFVFFSAVYRQRNSSIEYEPIRLVTKTRRRSSFSFLFVSYMEFQENVGCKHVDDAESKEKQEKYFVFRDSLPTTGYFLYQPEITCHSFVIPDISPEIVCCKIMERVRMQTERSTFNIISRY